MTASQVLPKRFPTTSYDRIARVTAAGGGDVTMHALVSLDGQLDADRLMRSVLLIFEQEPVLAYRYIDRPWRPYWERTETRAPRIQYARDELEKEGLIREYLKTPLDYRTSCQVDVRLFRSEKDTLCVNATHVSMDGAGLMDYISILSEVYRRLRTDPRYKPSPNLEGDRSPRQVLVHAGTKAVLRSMRRLHIPTFTWGLPITSQDFSGRRVITKTLEEGRVQGLVDYSHKRHVTVNDVLVAAFYRAVVSELNPPWDVPLPLMISSDLRRYLPSNRAGALCNLSGGLFPELSRKEEEFDETLERVHRAMEREKRSDAGLAEMLYMDIAFSFGFPIMRGMLPKIGMFLARPALSNMGLTDAKRIDFGHVDVLNVIPLPPLTHPPFFGFVLNTFKNKMNISTAYCDTATDPKLPVQILERFVDEIPSGKELPKRPGDAERSTLESSREYVIR